MSITCTIRGVTRHISPDTLGVSHTLFQRSTCEFSIPDSAGSIEVQIGENVTVEEGAYLWFNGTITELGRDKIGPLATRYLRIAAVDYSQMADRRIAPPDMTWTGAKANDIVRLLCTQGLTNEGTYTALTYERIGSDGTTTVFGVPDSQSTPTVYLDGALVSTGYTWDSGAKTITFTTAPYRTAQLEFRYDVKTCDLSLVAANSGPTVTEFKTQNNETIAACLTRLCKEIGGYYWRFDTSKRLRFETFTTGSVIATISNSSHNIFADSLSSKSTREQFANFVTIFFNNYTAVQTENVTGDGSKKVFTLSQEIVAEPTIRVNGSYKSVGLRGVDTGREVVWASGSKDIEFSTAPTAGAVIEVVYKGKSVGRADAFDGDSINARKLVEGGSGIYSKSIAIDYEVSPDKAQEIADAELARYLAMSTNITFDTDQIVAVPGDRVTASVTGIPTGTFVVRSVRTRLLGPTLMRSSLELVSGNFILDGLESLGSLAGYQPYAGGIPIERDTRPAIPDVILGDEPVAISQIQIDGVLKYKLDFTYTVPASGADNRFEGVQLFLDAEGRKSDMGSQIANAVEGENATFTVIMRLPETDQNWTFYLVSRNWNRSNTPVWKTEDVGAYASPNATIEAKAQPLTVDPTPEVSDENAGYWNADTEAWVHEGYYDSLGNLYLEWTAKLPADLTNVSGFQIYLHPHDTDAYNPATGLLDQFSAEPPTAEGILRDRIVINAIDVPVEGETWDVIFCSYDRAGNRTVADDHPTGPTVTITVPANSGGEVVPISALTLQQRLNALPRI